MNKNTYTNNDTDDSPITDDCPICLCPIPNREWGSVLPCRHPFHRACWNRWAATVAKNKTASRKVLKCAMCKTPCVNFIGDWVNPTFCQLLDSNLPDQSLVYVLFAIPQKRIHVVSCTASSKYAIAQNMMKKEKSRAQKNYIQRFLDCHGQQDHYDNFFSGLSSSTITDMIANNCIDPISIVLNTIEPNVPANTIVLPYTRYVIPDELLRKYNISQPIVKKQFFGCPGRLQLKKCDGYGKLAVSLPEHTSDFVFAKLDSLSYLDEYKYSNDSIFKRTTVSTKFEDDYLDTLRSNAIHLVRELPTHTKDISNFLQVSEHITEILTTSSKDRWPVTIHEHQNIPVQVKCEKEQQLSYDARYRKNH